jgi:glycosyltransferase involved in cell wall biosynthesis
MQKSVVIIGPAFPLRGGLSSYNERLTREFTSIGFQSSIYTFSLQYPSFLFPGTTQYSNEPKPADLDIHVKINSINPLNWIKVGLELKKRCPDIIVVRYWLPFMGPCLGTILRIVKSNKKTQIVCIADNIIPHEKRPGDSLFTSYFIKPIDAFITMSEKVLKDLSVLTTKKAIHVIHPLYDNFGESIDKTEAKEHLDILPSTPIVLFFGFIRKYKGLDLLLEAIHILNQRKYFEQNPIQFLIAGEFYDDSKPYTDLIDQYNISKFIILKNEFIADSEVKYYLSAADCVIQPYKSATQSGVTPLAYHFEKPMIVTNVGGLPTLVPEHIGMVAEPNPEAIATQIEQFFLQNQEAYISNIREEKKKYSWQNITAAILSLTNTK